MKILLVIPARYSSSRLPGKPLIKICGREMVSRVWENAINATRKYGSDALCIVATEDIRILNFCKEKGIDCIITSKDCKTGTDRVSEAVSKVDFVPDFVVNLQGDNPLCPPWFIENLIDQYNDNRDYDIVTPFVNLSWDELDELEDSKQVTPLSGTTVIASLKKSVNKYKSIERASILDAIWFSKKVLPSIRNRVEMESKMDKSPVLRHIGLYGYKASVLEKIPTLSDSIYDDAEALEQLKFLENGLRVGLVKVDYRGIKGMSGVDSPEDIIRAEDIINEYGEY